MGDKYRKIDIEFVYYDKNIGKSIYNVSMKNNKDKEVFCGNVFGDDVPKTVYELMSVDIDEF